MAVSIPFYSVDDLERFPDDGNRYELLEGVLLVTPAPSHLHQVIATRLAAYLMFGIGPQGEAGVVTPGVVLRPPGTQLEPDVLVYPSRFTSFKWGAITEHWLAAEIFSPSSKIYDREFKRGAYLALGVKEVWLVDADERTVEVSRPDGVAEVVRHRLEWVIPVTGRNVTIELAELFHGVI